MPRFRVIVTGIGMNLPDGCTGFATTRFVKSDSEKDAVEKALTIVAAAVADEPMFSEATKPILAVDTISRICLPFRRARLQKGYTLIGPGASLEDAVHLERKASVGWLF